MLIFPAQTHQRDRQPQLGEIHGNITCTARAILLAHHTDHRYRCLRAHAPTRTAPKAIKHDIANHGDTAGTHVG